MPCHVCVNNNIQGLHLDGRQLNVTMAISREEAVKVKASNDEKRKVDKRNLHLAKEGTMDLQSQESKLLSKSELVKRQRAASEKKAKLANPNYFVSKTRLCIRNLAASVSEKQLRDVLLKYIKGTPAAKIKQVKIFCITETEVVSLSIIVATIISYLQLVRIHSFNLCL